MLAWGLRAAGTADVDVAYALDVAPSCEDAECLRWLRYSAPRPAPPRGQPPLFE
jgi:hypothetical protein